MREDRNVDPEALEAPDQGSCTNVSFCTVCVFLHHEYLHICILPEVLEVGCQEGWARDPCLSSEDEEAVH